jgi:FkbM family methyltransferase
MSARLHLAARGVDLPGGEAEFELRLKPDLDIRLRRTDFILFEVIGIGSYDIDLTPAEPVERLLDGGANIGLATIVFSQRFPSARVAAVEPAQRSFELLERNLRINAPRAIAIHAAVTAEPGPVAVRSGRTSMLATIEPAGAESSSSVPGRTISQLLDQAGFDRADLLKLDIEGSERALLECAETWADRIGAVIAEIHPPLTVEAAAARLRAHGFEQVVLPPVAKFKDLLFAVRR